MTPEAAARHRIALEQFRLGDEFFKGQRKREKDDLSFQVPELQWATDVQKARASQTLGNLLIPERPMLSIATLDEPIQLVLNQEKAAHLGVMVHALSEEATDDTAETMAGLYRNIESTSRANLARSWAYDRAVKCGMGWYRVDKAFDPDGGHPGDQKLIFRRILNQASVLPDPFAQEPDWSDGEFLFITSDMRFTTYKRKYKDSKLAAYADSELVTLMDEQPGWVNGAEEASRAVRIAERWRVDSDTRKVFWSVINGREELEPEQEWDGQFIPIIPVIGRELQPFEATGERRWLGMIGPAKDGARLTNYAASSAVEMAALEPKAPWQGVEGVFEGHEKEYQESNIRNVPFLQYKRTGIDGQPAPPPERVQVELSRLGPSMELLRMGRDFVQMATGTFDPALGKQPTAHRSGRAIVALQDQTVAGTSHYLDNLAEISMTYEAMVVLDLMAKIYDRPGRIARILGEDQKTATTVMLNQPFITNPQTKRPMAFTGQADPADTTNPVKHYDLTRGRYGVSVTIGKSSGSRLQQGSEEMGAILEAAPELMPVIGPEYFTFRDFPGAKAIAKLLKKMRDHSMPWLSDDPTQNPQAQLAAAQQTLQQMDQALKEAQQIIDAKQVEIGGKVDIEKAKFAMDVEIQRMKNATAIEIAKINALAKGVVVAQQAENEQVALASEHAHAASEADAQRQHEQQLAQQDHAQTMQEGDLEHQRTLVQNEQTAAHTGEQMAAQPEPTAP